MVVAKKEMAVYCFDVLVSHFTGRAAPAPAFEGGHHPLFVSWKNVGPGGGESRMRGCIGTLAACSVHAGFKDLALTSALRDRRFAPIKAAEVPQLEVTVSLLTDYELAKDFLDWEVGTHGLIAEFDDPHQHKGRLDATYLPNVILQEGWTKLETIDALIRKAGYSGPVTDALRQKLRVTRYQSTYFSLLHADYADYVELTRGRKPAMSAPVLA